MENLETTRLGDLQVVRRFEPLLVEHGLTSLHALLDGTDGDDLDKPGLPRWRRRSRLTLSSDVGSITLYLKRYQSPPFVEQCRRLMRGWSRRSTAYIEWAWMHRLAAAGIPAVRPVAFGESMSGLCERCSVLLTEAVPGESLERLAQTDRAPRDRDALVAMADLVGRMHRQSFFHRDLYLSHVFHDDATPMAHAFRLIDLQRMINPLTRRRRWQIKDLAALHYSTPPSLSSASARLRFLKRYLDVERLTTSDKGLIRAIERKGRRIAGHDRRRSVRLGIGTHSTTGAGR